MGLDIIIGVDNYKDVYTPAFYSSGNNDHLKMKLSRTFCDLICRRHISKESPELDKIGKLTGVDISLFYEMETLWNDDIVQKRILSAKSSDEQDVIRQQIHGEVENKQNIDKVLFIVALLIERLINIEELPQKIVSEDYTKIDNQQYFSPYAGNTFKDNFIGDLNNFKRFLEYARSKGTKLVYFVFGS